MPSKLTPHQQRTAREIHNLDEIGQTIKDCVGEQVEITALKSFALYHAGDRWFVIKNEEKNGDSVTTEIELTGDILDETLRWLESHGPEYPPFYSL
jgi:hypothetical protein